MQNCNLKIALLFLLFFTCLTSSCKPDSDYSDEPGPQVSNHPFLIVNKELFSGLRQKASSEPWRSMKADAIVRSGKGSATKPYDLQYYIGAAALAYILDEQNSQLHASRVRNAIIDQYSKLTLKDGSDWGGVVPPMGSFFIAILSLDIVYDALSPEEVKACEKVISDKIFSISRSGSWVDARRGTHGTWDIYCEKRISPDNDYYNGIMAQITEDGVSPVTNHYAWERVGGGDSRISKSGYMDVLEFTGIDKRYYNNEQIKKFQRWLFGSSVNCSKEMAIFGDMLPTQGLNFDMLHMRVVNFDMEAAGYAAWFLKGKSPKGHILTYILPKSSLPEPIVPSSRIYTNGGAFFRDSADDPSGLQGVLYNIKSQDEWHTHNEVNGLALSGYGNRLLVNGGRLGAPTRPAPLNNTLTINGENHKSRLGGGIFEGFTDEDIDFAAGSSGTALTGSTHLRNLMLMHKTSDANPYFIIIDQVKAPAGSTIQTYLHPANQSSVLKIRDFEEYTADIDHYPTITGGKVTMFYATPPTIVSVSKVMSAVPDRYPGYPDHNRVEAGYMTGEDGVKNIVTIIFPQNESVNNSSLSRITDSGLTGCIVNHSGLCEDYIFETDGTAVVKFSDASFRASAVIYRRVNNSVQFYFVKDGVSFSENNIGFQSELPVTIHSKGKNGIILSPGTTVKLNGPGINNIKFNPAVEILNSGNDFIEVKLDKGKYVFSE